MLALPSPRILAVGSAFPPHYYDQESLLAALEARWGERHHNLDRLRRLHENVLVGGRHLALPIEEYATLERWGQANDAWIRVATDVGAAAIEDALGRAGVPADEVDALVTVTVTGVATPSLDARLMNRIGFRPDLKRTPVFGLGCLAGAAGLARVADSLRGFERDVALLLSVELCSLTLQQEDLSVANLIASGLFGDGAAAVVMAGGARATVGPRVVATRSSFYRDTERVMGWDVSEEGFRVVLDASVPDVVRAHLGADVDAFLADLGLGRRDVDLWIAHPGGPKVLEAMTETLGLGPDDLEITWRSLREVGNLSSASVLLVLQETLERVAPEPGARGLLLAMGPGFCSELVLLEW